MFCPLWLHWADEASVLFRRAHFNTDPCGKQRIPSSHEQTVNTIISRLQCLWKLSIGYHLNNAAGYLTFSFTLQRSFLQRSDHQSAAELAFHYNNSSQPLRYLRICAGFRACADDRDRADDRAAARCPSTTSQHGQHSKWMHTDSRSMPCTIF